MNSKKKILVISGSRSDYSLLKPLILKLKKEKKFLTQLIITGSHLEKKFGNTYKEIIGDKIKIDNKIYLNLKNADKKDIASSTSIGIKKFFNLFYAKKPDAIILLGDRYEIFSAAYAAYLQGVKIFHFAGGEKTPFVYDDIIRNCLSNFSNYHFVTNNEYKKNLVKKGINKKNIFSVGSLGIDNLKLIKNLNKKKILKKFKIENYKNFFLITFHPTTLFTKEKIISETKHLIYALDTFKDHFKIFTLPSADFANQNISKLIKSYCKKTRAAKCYESLGSDYYINLAKISDLIVGNSSSGLSEIPSIKKISINIGSRQKGRIYGNSVINSKSNKRDIIKNIRKGLKLSKNLKFIKKIKNPYGDGLASKRAINILKKII